MTTSSLSGETKLSFKVLQTLKDSNARVGILEKGNKKLETPCVFLDTKGGLPSYFTPQQLLLSNLPPHGYVIDIGDLIFMVSNKCKHDKIKSKLKKQKKTTTPQIMILK